MAYTYNLPFQSFNPWANYNTPQDNPSFNYTQDPYYNAGADTQKWDLAQTGPQSESNRARIWRWTQDDLKTQGLDPGKASQAQVQQAYLKNIGRLRNDYQVNGFDWNKSGYSGYDKFQATTPATGPGTSPIAPPNTPSPTVNGGPSSASPGGSNNQGTGTPSTQPKTIVVSGIPYTLQPDGSYTNARGQTPQQAGADPNATSNAIAGGNGQNGNPGTAFGSDVLSQDPDLAYQYMLRQLGWDPTAPSRFGDILKKQFSPLLQADLATSAVSGGGAGGAQYLDNLQNTIANFARGAGQQGGNFFGNESAKAQNVLQDPTALDYLGQIQDQSQVEQYLNQLATLEYTGSNPLIQQSIADSLQSGQQQYDYDAFNQVNTGQSQGDPYLTWLRNNAKYNRYLGVR